MGLFNLGELKTPEGAMRATWHTAIFAASLLLFMSVVLFLRPASLTVISRFGLIVDAALVLALGFGVRKRSRTCATVLFALWVVNLVYAIFCLHATFSIVGLLVGITYFAGMTGAFEFHRRIRQAGPTSNEA